MWPSPLRTSALGVLCALGNAIVMTPACNPKAPVASTPASSPAAPLAPRSAAVSCEEAPYTPSLPSSAAPARLPVLPLIPDVPARLGTAFSVAGAIYGLRHLRELDKAENEDGDIVIEGIVVDTNVERAPACAFHPDSKPQPAGCVAEIPSFWIADDDTRSATPAPRILVLGWASSFSQIYDARQAAKARPPLAHHDAKWGTKLPSPLPTVGRRVRVTGAYGRTFWRASSGPISEPRTGILSFSSMEYL